MMGDLTMRRILLAAVAAALLAAPAFAQSTRPLQTYPAVQAPTTRVVTGAVMSYIDGSGNAQPVDATHPMYVTGSFTASLGGFTPSASAARGTPLSVTTSDSSGNLPTGAVVVVSNVGANPMYCNVNGIAATTSDQYISASGGWFAFTIPAAVTTLHCIATGSSTTANMVGGAGLATGTGGGSGAGGSSAITTWAGGTLGAMATYGTSPGAVLVPGMNSFVTNTVAVSGTFWQATQPISAASLPLPALAATSTKQSDGTQKTQIVDGSGNVIGATSNALDINIKSGNPTSIAATQSGTWTVQPGNTANTTPWLVTGTGGTFPSTVANGADVALGSTTDAAAANSSATSTLIGVTKGILAATQGAIPTQSAANVIGGVGINSGGVASGAYASGSIASGAFASGSIASGAVASGAIASGALASGSIAAGAQVDLLTMRGTEAPGTAAANSLLAGGVYNATPPTLTDGQQVALQLGSHGHLLMGNAGYPGGATPITISATGTTATTATLATGASVTTYLCGFSIRANANAAATANSTVTGTITGTLNYTQWTAPNASGIGITEQIFTPCIPASAVNTGIAVISAAPGTGGVVSVSAWGYTL